MPSFNSDTALIYMDIFYFNVNEEKNPESGTPYININNELQLHNGYIFIFYFKIWHWYIALLLKI